MPAINAGRSNTNYVGRHAGRRTTKPRAERAADQRRTTRQVQRQRKAAAPANRRADVEHDRKVVLRASNEKRQLGLDARDKSAPKAQTFAVAGPRGQTITHTTSKPTSDAIKKIYAAIGKEPGGKGVAKISPGQMAMSSVIPAMAIADLIGGKPRKLANNAFKDVYNYPPNIAPSLVQTGSALNEARKGNTKPIVAMAKDFDANDAGWNALVAGAKLSAGDIKGAKKRIRAAGKSAFDHPALAAAELVGGAGTTGRLITRFGTGTARVAESRAAEAVSSQAAKVSPKLGKVAPKVARGARKVSSTERAPAKLTGTDLEIPRHYSRDALQRLGQKRYDERQRRHAKELRERADRETDIDERRRLRERAVRTDPDLLDDDKVARAVHEHADANEKVRRLHAAQVDADIDKMTGSPKRAKKSGPLAAILTQRITKADLPELERYHALITKEGQKLAKKGTDHAKIAANQQLVQGLGQAIIDLHRGKIKLDRVARLAEEFAAYSERGQAELTARDIVDPEQNVRAVGTPHAAVNLGVKTDPKRLKEAVAIRVGEEAEARKTAGKAKRKQTRLSDKQASERSSDLEATAKREASLPPTKPDPRRQRVRGAKATPTRGEAVAAYIKRVMDMDPEDVEAAIKREDARTRKATKAKTATKTTKKAAVKAGERTRAAKRIEKENPLLKPDGTPVSTKELADALEGKPTAFITHKPGSRGQRGAYFRSADKPVTVTGKKRTHKATVQGTFNADPEVLREQARRTQTLIDTNDGFKRVLHSIGRRENPKPGEAKGKLVTRDTFDEAAQIARDLSEKEGQQWTVIRENPLGATNKQLQKMLEDGQPGGSTKDRMLAALNPTDTSGAGPWAIIPQRAADELQAQLKVMNPGDFARLSRAGTTIFRKAVLSMSLPWLAGNTAEGVFRSAVNVVGPRAYRTGQIAKQEAREAAAAEVRPGTPDASEIGEARTVGTGHYSYSTRNDVHSSPDDYKNRYVRGMAQIAKEVGEKPGPRQVIKGWQMWTHLVFEQINKRIEDQFQTAMLGKAIRNDRAGRGQRQIATRPKALMTKRAQALSDQAAKEAGQGMVSENTAAALGREIDRMYGKYSKFSPGMRSFIANYSPFIAWTLNAARFVARLPIDHPAFTGMTAAVQSAQREWLKDQGLGLWLGDKTLPEFLQGSVPDKQGGHYRAPTRYTPMSLLSDLPGTISGNVLPQISGPLLAMKGLDWKGDKLKDKDGKELEGPIKFVKAAEAYADSTIPALALGKRIDKNGPYETLVKRGLLQYAPRSDNATRGGAAAKVKRVDLTKPGGMAVGTLSRPGGSGGGSLSRPGGS